MNHSIVLLFGVAIWAHTWLKGGHFGESACRSRSAAAGESRERLRGTYKQKKSSSVAPWHLIGILGTSGTEVIGVTIQYGSNYWLNVGRSVGSETTLYNTSSYGDSFPWGL